MQWAIVINGWYFLNGEPKLYVRETPENSYVAWGRNQMSRYKTFAVREWMYRYATSLTYVDKLCAIIEKWNLTRFNDTGNATTTTWYRVRKTWADSKSQKGAFHSLENAKKCADENAGYSVFDEAGNAVYPVQQQFTPYRVRVKINDLNIRKGPGIDCAKWGKYTGAGVFTIVEEADGPGATKWGLLKSYADKRNGWISLDYTSKI